MNRAANPACPSRAVLVDWLDGLLEMSEEDRIEAHLDECADCRAALLAWQERLGGAGAPSAGCPDDETIVAYGTESSRLDALAIGRLERHLSSCEHCAQLLQRVVTPLPDDVAAPAVAPPPTRLVAKVSVASWIGAWLASLRGAVSLDVRWPALAAAAALLITVVRFATPMGPDNQVRDLVPAAAVEVVTDTVGYARPAAGEPIVATLPRGSVGRWLEVSGEWTRIELADGRRVWVATTAVADVGGH